MHHVDMIPKEEVLERIENHADFRLVEVLSEEDYAKGHLPGAISIPGERIEVEAPGKLAKDDDIVVYCASYSCHASTEAARKLVEMGYEDVHDYKGGKKDWRAAGLPLETSGSPATRGIDQV